MFFTSMVGDWRGEPLIERKAALKKLLRGFNRVRYVQHIEEDGEALFAQVDQLHLEGIVAKRAASTYRAGRTSHWLKIKTSIGKAREAQRMEHRRA